MLTKRNKHYTHTLLAFFPGKIDTGIRDPCATWPTGGAVEEPKRDEVQLDIRVQLQ